MKGSPPPMRGKVILNHLEPLSRRITPAYAGKSRKSPKLRHFHRGSPPPMRGKAPFFPQNTHRTGITPAYAGKSPYSVL